MLINIDYDKPNYLQEIQILQFLFNPDVLSAISGVILAIIGLYLTFILYNQQKDREDEQNKKRELLQKIEYQINHHETEDMRVLLREISELPYNSRFQEVFDYAYKQEFQEICIYKANERLVSGKSREGIEIIEDIVKIFRKNKKNKKNQEIADNLHHAAKILSESEGEEDIDKIVEFALWLWGKYDESAREIVICTFEKVRRKTSFEVVFKEKTQNTQNTQRLLLDDRLRGMREKKPLILYEWPTWSPLPVKEEHKDEKRRNWLGGNGLIRDPFVVPLSVEPKLLEEAWTNPEGWQEIEDPGWTVITSSSLHDLEATALRLCYEKRPPNEATDVFSALLPLPTHDLSSPVSHEQCLETIARAVAATWIALLARSPGALIDLPRPETALLVEFLTWSAGSGRRLLLQLEGAGLGHEKASDRYLRRLCGEFSQSLWQGAATAPRLRSWLRLRPPELEATYLIAYPSSPAPSLVLQAEARTLLAMAESLRSDGIHLKLFAPSLAGIPHVIELEWSPDRLQDMLADRIAMAYRPEDRKSPRMPLRALFAELEKLPDISLFPDVDALISRKAQGSLSRMLDLAGKVVDSYLDGKEMDELQQEISTT